MSILEDLRNLLNNNPFKGYYKINRLRPPGEVSEKRFMELCIRCARCIEVCPYDSIKRADLYERLQIGTPYVFAEEKACYLCMKCSEVCPTKALDPKITDKKEVTMGKAVIDQELCYNYIYYREEETERASGKALLCSTCYNACPLMDEAIVMEKFILPVTTEKCVGCGICTEKCPTIPEKAINIIPEGMMNKKEAGFFYRKYNIKPAEEIDNNSTNKHEETIEKKEGISSFGSEPDFEYDFEIHKNIEGWD